ncbi:MAG: hypothetical protein CTY19_18295 [Methylomonas sp.]|nr:MAG: hypothetical protein CTY19_18295 [Methylomonas sp.]
MNKIVSLLVLALSAAPAFANPTFGTVPEPEVLSLVGIGMLAIMVSRKFKK